jgi:hypothetical protein
MAGQTDRVRSYLKKRAPVDPNQEAISPESNLGDLEIAGAYWLAKQREEASKEKLRKNLLEEGALIPKDKYISEFLPLVKEMWLHMSNFPDTIGPYLHGLTKAKIRDRLVKELDKISKDFLAYLYKLEKDAEKKKSG